MKKKLKLSPAFLVLLLSCGSSDPSPDTVASVGNTAISLTDVQNSLIIEPQYSIRTPLRQARESQVNHLIRAEQYLLTAEESGLASDSLISRRIGYISRKEALKALLRRQFLDSIAVGDPELLRATARLQQLRQVQHLISDTKEGALRLRALLLAGTAIEYLQKDSSGDLKGGGDLGQISFGDLDPALEDAAYALQPGELSPPVETRYGYHILQLLNIEENKNSAALAENIRNDRIREIIKNRRADAQIRPYVAQLAGGKQFRLHNRTLASFSETIQLAMGDKYQQKSLFVPTINDTELRRIRQGSAALLESPLAIFGEDTLTVRQTLERLGEMPPLRRPYLHSTRQIGQFLLDELRLDLLMQEALAKGLDRSPEVQQAVHRHRRELLIHEVKARLLGEEYKSAFPAEHARLEAAFRLIRNRHPGRIYMHNLFSDTANPDSTMLPAPIHLFIRNKYIW